MNMKSLFLNNFKKYTVVLLLVAFGFNLFFYDVSKATGAPAQEPTQQLGWWKSFTKFVSDKWYQAWDLKQGEALTAKEYIFDPIAWTAANVIIDKFGDAMVDWIRSGFQGSPMFLSDPEGFFKDTANDFSGALIDALDMEWLCQPLGKLNINLDFFFPGTDRTKYECTFNDVADNFENIANRDDLSDWISLNVDTHKQNIVRVFGRDYRNGGLLMWLNSSNKKNNDLGRTLQVASDAYMGVSMRVGNEKFGLGLNQGFFGVKKCVEWRDNTNNVNQDLLNPSPSGSFSYDAGNLASERKCVKYETKSPGQLVQDQLKSVGGKDLSRLQIADEINEIIGALASTMIGWLLTGGNDGEGVTGYDKDADYSGSNRDHYGNLTKGQQVLKKKTNISEQIQDIKSNEQQYSKSLSNYAESLYDAKDGLEKILDKLECIYATSTNDTAYDYENCDDDIEEVGKNLSVLDKDGDALQSDISSVSSAVSGIDNRIGTFHATYGENATSTSEQVVDLFDEFQNNVMNAEGLAKIKGIIQEYCYSFNKNNKTGKICGLFADKYGEGMEIHLSAENNPVLTDNSGEIKTKIYWKSLNAESCDPSGGGSDKAWKKLDISTSGSYTTPSFNEEEERNYGIKCVDEDNNSDTVEIDLAADSAGEQEISGTLLASSLYPKDGMTSTLYWLTTNASQCYLYSDKDNFDNNAEYLSYAEDSEDKKSWYTEAGYYLKLGFLNRTSGQETGAVNSGEVYKYKLICGDSSDVYSSLSELEIAPESDERETYKTHSEKEANTLSKEASKVESRMDELVTEYTCLLNEYTFDEDVRRSECDAFKESSSDSE
ncbi:hypothetical protein C4572_00350 [Candidatus Parcubacteria bacterium]|nr:MAG: hypothetical protein C4572_00350 [Candidatus Parcubacteria bacterium]